MSRSNAVLLQLQLPFNGVQDRIRSAADAGRVVFLPEARADMDELGISDILILRSMQAAAMVGLADQGSQTGEWGCSIVFAVKGFRAGGIVKLKLFEGRAFVESIRWDIAND